MVLALSQALAEAADRAFSPSWFFATSTVATDHRTEDEGPVPPPERREPCCGPQAASATITGRPAKTYGS